ncbi:thermonuclease family protein [Rhizobium giardinii]|uniref:thermonuclease family protein n=1 Tax=Rhizobium giardinii TaxID=56731 RepID=UPI003D70184C
MRKVLILLSALWPATAGAAPDGYFDLLPGVTLESGDTWISNDERFRLYGVQSCLRGTLYTDRNGAKRDCGEASLAVLAAYIKDTKPACAAVAKKAGIAYVVCYAMVGKERLDLANILITSGYAFASLDHQGMPYHVPYAVSERYARDKRAGLWQFDDVQHPAILLSREVNARTRKAAQ